MIYKAKSSIFHFHQIECWQREWWLLFYGEKFAPQYAYTWWRTAEGKVNQLMKTLSKIRMTKNARLPSTACETGPQYPQRIFNDKVLTIEKKRLVCGQRATAYNAQHILALMRPQCHPCNIHIVWVHISMCTLTELYACPLFQTFPRSITFWRTVAGTAGNARCSATARRSPPPCSTSRWDHKLKPLTVIISDHRDDRYQYSNYSCALVFPVDYPNKVC